MTTELRAGIGVGEARARASRALGGTRRSRREADWLLSHVLGTSVGRLLATAEQPLAPAAVVDLNELIARRLSGEPLDYVLGSAYFLDLELEVSPAVLIPRPETELLAQWALTRLRVASVASVGGDLQVADVGTGSGALALVLAREPAVGMVLATDISPAALEVARRNVARHGFGHKIELELCDLLPDSRCFDLVVANLPYIAPGELRDVAQSVVKYEPAKALFAGPSGLELTARLLRLLANRIAPGGAVGLEIGWRQSAALLPVARSHFPRARIRVIPDEAGRDRVLAIELS